MSLNAIKCAEPIQNQYALQISRDIMKVFKDKLNINSCTLGSTGKKNINEYSGDIDIAIELEMTDDNIEKIKQFINDNFALNQRDLSFYVSKGINILSFSYPYEVGLFRELKCAQIDLMFSTNLEFTKFIYHSPNYIKKESNFKGLYRTNLLTYIAGRVPTNISDITDDNGNLTDYWKYTLTYNKGLKLTHKTYKGKKGLLKNSVTVKEDNEYITMNPNEIVKFILGEKATIETTNSFESLIDYLFSKNYPYKDSLFYVLSDFINDNRHDEKLKDIVEYIYNTVKTKVDPVFFYKNIASICVSVYNLNDEYGK